MDIKKLNEEIKKALDENIEDSLPIGDREEVFNPKSGDIVRVMSEDEQEKDFYGIMGPKIGDQIQVTKLCDTNGNLLSGEYKATKYELYDGEGLKKLIDKLETNLSTLRKYV